ncbi:MAG TPA: pseudouridine synthase [Blastocatellia bacterium]|nr:pseudouridine synthase [Blastocatellia bacterium]
MTMERLQKIIAGIGIASRRAAEEMITRGEVSVNGRVVTELGSKADPARDHIKVRGKLINAQSADRPKRYLLINKPRGYLSSVSDPKQRPLVAHLLTPSMRRGLHPVGRLDFNTEGLIVLTDDGDLTQLLTKGGAVEKVYHVKVKGSPTAEQIDRLRRGMKLGESRTAPAEIKLLERTKEGGNSWYEVILREGKNQQIRRMFDSTGHSVTKLRRVRIGHLTDQGLGLGEYRELKPGEVSRFFQAKTNQKIGKRKNRKAPAKKSRAAKR